MRVRWTSAAADDLENIATYLFEKTPENAARLIREIYAAPTTLKDFPNRGRAGKKEGTRELVTAALHSSSALKTIGLAILSNIDSLHNAA